jgi:hypothetical protein
VGCGQQVFTKDGKVVRIEGDPDSPLSSPMPAMQRLNHDNVTGRFQGFEQLQRPAVHIGLGPPHRGNPYSNHPSTRLAFEPGTVKPGHCNVLCARCSDVRQRKRLGHIA